MKFDIIKYTDKRYNEVINLKLKKDDENEVIKMTNKSVKESNKELLEQWRDYIFLIEYNGNIEGIVGVVPTEISGIGQGIFVTTDKIEEFKWYLARNTRKIMDSFFSETINHIIGYVPKSYLKSVNWLLHNGIIFDDIEYESNEEIFLKFNIYKGK